MNHSTLRTLFSIFLIAHALVTMSLAIVPVSKPGAVHTPFFPSWWRKDVDEKWPVSRLGLDPVVIRTIGWVLWLSAAILFILADIGLLGMPLLVTLWQPLALAAAVISIVLLALFWHPWDVVGLLLNIGIGAGVMTHLFDRWLG